MKKRILLVYTGGTIGMVMGQDGYTPDGGFDHKIRVAQQEWPEITAAIDWSWMAIEPPIDSANMTQQHWLQMRSRIVAALAQDTYDGVIVLHGTDTLAYTAAALTFMLHGLSVPVILTGSMRPADTPDTDAWGNLFGAMLAQHTALASGVYVYFHGRLLSGVRASKFHGDQDDAFQVLRPETPLVQTVQPPFDYRSRLHETRLALVPLYPGLQADVLAAVLSSGVQGVVLECYGVGTGPADDAGLMQVLRQAAARGQVLVAISQCPAGTMLLGHYAASSQFLQTGVLPSGSMTREAALAKLMCLLGTDVPVPDIPIWWEKNLCGEYGSLL